MFLIRNNLRQSVFLNQPWTVLFFFSPARFVSERVFEHIVDVPVPQKAGPRVQSNGGADRGRSTRALLNTSLTSVRTILYVNVNLCINRGYQALELQLLVELIGDMPAREFQNPRKSNTGCRALHREVGGCNQEAQAEHGLHVVY